MIVYPTAQQVAVILNCPSDLKSYTLWEWCFLTLTQVHVAPMTDGLVSVCLHPHYDTHKLFHRDGYSGFNNPVFTSTSESGALYNLIEHLQKTDVYIQARRRSSLLPKNIHHF